MRNAVRESTTATRATQRLAIAAGLSLLATTALLAAAPARAEDPVKVDPKHYKVEFENDQVRVLRISYGPHEKSVMHSHPAGVAVFLTDGHGKFTMPGGKTEDAPFKAGTVQWQTPITHLPENLGDKGFELIEVELKAKPAAAK
jgi:quercetin dioxygenase-like cupin family protein